MPICQWCGRSKRNFRTTTCTANKIIHFDNGVKLPAIPWRGPGSCPECHVIAGGHHHPECPREECPKCRGYINDCDCTGEGSTSPKAQKDYGNLETPKREDKFDHLLS